MDPKSLAEIENTQLMSMVVQQKDKNLAQFLLSLPEEKLTNLVTIMYYGRGDDDNIHEFRQSLGSPGHYPITGKRPEVVKDYFDKAVEKASQNNIDLNELN